MSPLTKVQAPARVRARTADPPQIQALWALTPTERIDAMWDSKLTATQLNVWTRRAPHEVPLLSNEFAWIVMRTDEWLDTSTEDQSTDAPMPNNVVALPQRKESHRVAA
jgi:hypothetical protein